VPPCLAQIKAFECISKMPPKVRSSYVPKTMSIYLYPCQSIIVLLNPCQLKNKVKYFN
jgi:hypothetical protein